MLIFTSEFLLNSFTFVMKLALAIIILFLSGLVALYLNSKPLALALTMVDCVINCMNISLISLRISVFTSVFDLPGRGG